MEQSQVQARDVDGRKRRQKTECGMKEKNCKEGAERLFDHERDSAALPSVVIEGRFAAGEDVLRQKEAWTSREVAQPPTALAPTDGMDATSRHSRRMRSVATGHLTAVWLGRELL